MKKLLLILLCLPLIGFGQITIWSDDCSSASTWTITNSSTQGFEWEIEMDPYITPAGGTLTPMASVSATNGFMFINSDLNGGPDGNGTVISTEFTNANPIDLSAYPNVQLTFQHNFRWWHDTRIVRVSPDNGVTWVELDEITNDVTYTYPNQSSDNPHMSTYDISSVAGGQSEVLVQFYYNDNDVHAWYWAIDDIVISDPTFGCMDPSACNYNPLALTDDGSCNSSSSTFFTIAHCDSYTWSVNGNTYVNSGLYTSLSTNSFGCDHIDTLDLTITNSTSSIDTHVACDEFMWYCDGNTYTSSNNTATYVYTNVAGCDSIVTLDLTINNSSSNGHLVQICDFYTWPFNGQTYTTSGTYTDISTNAAGCTHTETLYLTITNSTSNSNIATACDTYYWGVNENIYTSSGTYTDINTNSFGCENIDTLILTIINSTTSSTSVTSCDSYDWNGMTYTSSGSYDYLSTNAVGCDSVVILDLIINNLPTSNIWQTGDELFAITPPNNVSVLADWYNIQTQDGITRIWLMEEQSSSFSPTFDCSYFIVIKDGNECIDTSSVYDYAASAKRIGSLTTLPNPTSGLTKVNFNNTKNQFVRLELINSNGSKLDEFITTENYLDIDLSQYPAGNYYLYFNSEGAVQGCRLEEKQKISTKIILNK